MIGVQETALTTSTTKEPFATDESVTTGAAVGVPPLDAVSITIEFVVTEAAVTVKDTSVVTADCIVIFPAVAIPTFTPVTVDDPCVKE